MMNYPNENAPDVAKIMILIILSVLTATMITPNAIPNNMFCSAVTPIGLQRSIVFCAQFVWKKSAVGTIFALL